MGRKRLIVQADLTSEEDQAFLAWVKQKLRRRKLAEEIRQGLRVQYERSTGQAGQETPLPGRPAPVPPPPAQVALDEREETRSSHSKLKKLVQGF